MNKKRMTYVKFGLDILMAVTFVLFFNKRVLGGLTFHEIAGLVIAAVFFTHVLLNWRWVRNVTVKLFHRKLSFKTRLGYFLNIMLLITMAFIIVSGVFISKVVFPNINIGNEPWFKITHISVSFLTLILVAAHVGLHWKWVIHVFKNIVNIKPPKRIFGILVKTATVALLVLGIYQMYSTHFIIHLLGVASVFSPSSAQIEKGGERPDLDGEERPSPPGGKGQFGKGNFADGELEEGERANLEEGSFKGGKGEHGSTNPLSVIISYFSMMSVFIIIIYYLEKLFTRIKHNKKNTSIEPDLT